jgi:hypothetical protein
VGLATSTSTRGAAEVMGIPHTTIRYWLDDPEFAHLRTETRDRVAEELWAAVQMGIKEVAKALRDPDAGLRDKAVAFGILYDKHALLTGGATNRSESRDITGTLSDAELIAALAEADRLTSAEGTAKAMAEPTEG